MQLKMFVLSGSALILWLAPLTALDRRVGWHKLAQGLSLGSAVVCAVSAGNLAKKIAEDAEIEEWKARAIKADVADEIAVSTYVSQQSRQQEAEQILNGQSECSEDVQRLERALALPCSQENIECSEQSDQLARSEEDGTENKDAERREQIMQLRARGYGKGKIILEIWGLNRGGSQKYKDAEAEYKRLIGEEA
ncbi:hypothetical protein [Microcoleus sp. B3-D7]|uniref:hypothetical protein n=1 Tax=Microcoleus sp. B3-D7 TaxID=2818659 RepID=UPI002FD6C0C2